jgi:hypothetical protein
VSIVLLYDVRVLERKSQGVNEAERVKTGGVTEHVVFEARSVRGAPHAFELVAEYYRRRRAPGATPSCRVEVTCHRVDGESLYRFGNAVVLRDEDEHA